MERTHLEAGEKIHSLN